MIKLDDLKKLVKEVSFISEMKAIFFEAMNAGYASEEKPQKGTIIELPGSKVITYVRGPWKVTDIYLITPLSTRSGGMTIISYEGVPVWMMQYFGEYQQVAIPCLKAALRAAYENKQFFGGRGPEFFEWGAFAYTNASPRNVWVNHNFGDRFNGEEMVVGEKGTILGWHSYQGGGMI